MKILIKILFVIVTVAILVMPLVIFLRERNIDKMPTQKFIETWLQNSNRTLATYIKEDELVDEDLVKGREALAETLSFWMLYALEMDDKRLFKQSFEVLQDYFLEEDGFVNWKVNESGESEVYTNALADDLRIADALFLASEKWNLQEYENTAKQIGRYLNKFNVNSRYLVDYYERFHRYNSDSLTLSYIDQGAMEKLKNKGVLNQETFTKTSAVLRNAPLRQGFYPKKYNLVKRSYVFDQEINMVDQALTAYHQVENGSKSVEFLNFIKEEIQLHGVIYGRYDLQTGNPAVAYESPAVYGILLMYCLKIGEDGLAGTLYKRMIQFRNNDVDDPYYGGYSVGKSSNTHIFDNLVPLLAEKRYLIENSKNSP